MPTISLTDTPITIIAASKQWDQSHIWFMRCDTSTLKLYVLAGNVCMRGCGCYLPPPLNTNYVTNLMYH